ncbi:transposase [Streptomyces sp. NPDC056121]|uniref:transposase n=1 Tax=Streptomyces sp. NPDC056121 TaxID=3345718 RepID=UPI0035D8F626
MREVSTDFETEFKQFNDEEDHVHLLAHYPPKTQLSKPVNSPKDASPCAVCARSATRTSAATCGAATPGPLLHRWKL